MHKLYVKLPLSINITMKKITVKDLKKALENLDESKEIFCTWSLDTTNIEVDYVKEIKENGREYYKIKM